MNILLVDDEELQLLRLEKACKKVLPDDNYFCYSNSKLAYEENINNNSIFRYRNACIKWYTVS